jgi:hypothetical protein
MKKDYWTTHGYPPVRGWQDYHPPRRIDWRRVAEAAGIIVSGVFLSLLLWVCWLVYVTSLAEGR